MKKLVFVDSDGTLKNNSGNISDKTKQIIKELQAHDIEIIITTGRPRYHALKVKNNSNASRYIISSNGAEIYDCLTEKIIYANYIDNESIIKVFNICKNTNARFIMTIDDKEVVSDEIKNDSQIMLKEKLEDFLVNNKVKQLFIRSDNELEARKTYKEIKQLKRVKIINESSYFKTGIVEAKGIWFTITNKNVNKGEAIKKLCNYLNVDLENTYAFGNDYNDLEMFDTVNYSIVMDNANEDLKKKATMVAKSNDEEGVALFLENLFMN